MVPRRSRGDLASHAACTSPISYPKCRLLATRRLPLPHHDTPPILQRLLAVTSATRDAFAEAAYATRSPRLAALFVRRAEHQQRIASFLVEHLAPGRVPAADASSRTNRTSIRALLAGGLGSARDPHALLGACIRVLDTAILEFCRAYTPTMPLATRISLERHHDQMRWSREELFSLRRSYKSPRSKYAHSGMDRPLGVGEEIWFGVADDKGNPDTQDMERVG